MDLKELHDKLISEGCNQFYIEGVGGPVFDDVHCLGQIGEEWAVYYVERGMKSTPIFSTRFKSEAIDYYYKHVTGIDNWHLVVFTRSKAKKEEHQEILEKHGVQVVQNDIPNYSGKDDVVYRLFVVNKAIFKAREVLDTVPFYDEDLKR